MTERRSVRRGSVDLVTRGGDRVHHDEAVVRYLPDEFVVAPDADFDPSETVRYEKADLVWFEVRHPRS